VVERNAPDARRSDIGLDPVAKERRTWEIWKMLKSNCLALLATVAVTASPVLAQEKGMPGSLMRSSHVVGMDVKNASNENLGDIKEVVLDREKGTIAYAVISFGGFLNMGDKLFAVPWESLKPTSDGKAFQLDIPKERLEKAPGFDKDQWPNMADAQWTNEIRTFYGTGTRVEPLPSRPRGEDGLAGDRKPDDAMRKTDDRGRYPDPNRDDRVFKKTENDGMGAQGDRKYDGVGRDHLTDDGMKGDRAKPQDPNAMNGNRANPQDPNSISGRQQIVTRTGTIRSFTRGDHGQLVLATTQGELSADLGSTSLIEQNNLRLDDGAQVTVRGYETAKDGRNTFVVTEVISNERTVRLRNDPAIGNDTGTYANTTTTTADSPYPIRDLSGTVSYVESSPCEESGYGRQVTIRTADGDRVVALAPGNYLDSRHWVLRPNDTVAVRGYDYDRNGRRVFIATELRRGSDTWTFRRADLTPVWANR
jgi:sporulation protein YlmC with PRC-barrel domain